MGGANQRAGTWAITLAMWLAWTAAGCSSNDVAAVAPAHAGGGAEVAEKIPAAVSTVAGPTTAGSVPVPAGGPLTTTANRAPVPGTASRSPPTSPVNDDAPVRTDLAHPDGPATQPATTVPASLPPRPSAGADAARGSGTTVASATIPSTPAAVPPAGAPIWPQVPFWALSGLLVLLLIWTAMTALRWGEIRLLSKWVVAGTFALLWAVVAGGFQAPRIAALIGTGTAAFACGSLLAFLFSSSGDEQKTFGRLSDWLIGGIASFTLVQFGKSGTAAAAPLATLIAYLSPTPEDDRYHAAAAVVCGALGFYSLYFLRITDWNSRFARANRDRREFEKTESAVAADVKKAIARNNPGDEQAFPAKVQTAARTYLRNASAAGSGPTPVLAATSWNPMRAAAPLAVQAPPSAADLRRRGLVQIAAGDLQSAERSFRTVLRKDPDDPDALFYLAYVLIEQDKVLDAVPHLDKLTLQPAAPAAAWKLLGYALLWDEKRLDESLAASRKYLKLHPSDAGVVFNMACAYAQQNKPGLRPSKEIDPDLRAKMERCLDWAIRRNPAFRDSIAGLMADDGDFSAFAGDRRFAAKYLSTSRGAAAGETNPAAARAEPAPPATPPIATSRTTAPEAAAEPPPDVENVPRDPEGRAEPATAIPPEPASSTPAPPSPSRGARRQAKRDGESV
jgi:tetratricopeptide (TPR) repeat protein